MSKTVWPMAKVAIIAMIGAFLLWISLIKPMLHKSDVATATIPLVNGKTLDITALRGKVVVLNFWSPDCPPCIQELPDLERLYQTYRARGLVVVGIATPGSSRSRSLAAAAMAHVTYPLSVDQSGTLTRAVGGIMVTPTQVIIDREGRVIDKYQGVVSGEEPMDEILQALQQK